MYHDIPEKTYAFQTSNPVSCVSVSVLTPLQFLDFINGKYCLSGINLLITFDDGFKSNRIVADKILEPLGIKGIFLC